MTTLKAALQEACFMELEDIPSEEELSTNETLTFSPAFEKKMMKLIRRTDHPIRYRIIRAAACALLAAVLSGCTVLAFVPEARATFTRWVTEWYESHVVYRYAGGSIPEDLPQYEITELPEGFVESKRTESPGMANITYKNESGDVISLKYIFMAQGGATFFGTENSDIFDIEVHHMSGQFFESKIPGNFNRITWIDTDQNIQFGISGAYSYADILRMAESVQKHNFPEDLPQYEITKLPEGFVESERTEFPRSASITCENESGDVIYFNYRFMSQGGGVTFGTEDSDIFDIKVNHMSGQFFESKIPGNFNAIIWIDEDQNIQFDISGEYSYADILRMAESVSFVKTKNETPE